MYVFGNESSNEAIVKSFILTGLPDSTSGGDSLRIVPTALFKFLFFFIKSFLSSYFCVVHYNIINGNKSKSNLHV